MNTKRVRRGWFAKQGRRRSIGYRPRVELLEDRITPATLEVPLDPVFDLFGDQFEVVQSYNNDDGLGDRVTFGIFDTGASPVTFGWSDQLFFDLLGQAIPVLPGVEVTAEGVGGSLTGLVSEPGTILADGLHALDLVALFNGEESIDLSNAAAVGNVQAMIGTETGSPNLPAIVGTPILNGRLAGSQTDGVAALIEMQGYLIDFGELFPEFPEFQGLILPLPDLAFVAPGTLLTAGPETTEALRVPIDFFGIDNHLDPGTTITESYNPVVLDVQATNTVEDVPLEVHNRTFLFDTGAQLSIISTDVALALGLDLANPETTIDIQGAGGSDTVPGYTIDRLIVPRDDDNDGVIDGTLEFTNVPVFVLDVDPSFDGILGMNLVNTAAQFLYDPNDPDGAGPAGPSLQFTFSTVAREPPDEESLGALNELFPAFAGSLGGQSVPGFNINHAPSVAADEAAVTVQEGQEASNAGTFTDLDGDPIQISTDIGDVTQNAATWSWSLATTDGPVDPVTVTITANDGHGGAQSTTFTYAVENVTPTIAISGAGNLNEGDTYTLTLDAVTDPGADTITDYIVNWGDGNSDTYSSVGAKTHPYADGPNSYAITVDLKDEDGTFLDRANALSVTVDNVTPTIVLSGNSQVNKLAPYTLQLGAVVDPGDDAIAGYEIHWGDGSSTGFISGSPTGQSPQHAYDVGGVTRTILVDLYDEDGNPHPAAGSKTVTVLNAAPNLKVKYKDTPGAVQPGDIVTFSMTLTNLGTSLATGAFVIFQLPPGMALVSDGSTPGWQDLGAQLYRLELGTLDVRQTVKVIFKASVALSVIPDSRLVTLATIADDGLHGPDSDLADNQFQIVTRVKK